MTSARMWGFVFADTLNETRIMAIKTFAYFKKTVIFGVVLLGVIAGTNGGARPGASNQDTVIVAQNETQTATDEKKAPSTEGREPEAGTEEAQESSAGKKKPLKDFQPSEQIEAEQAVDFPYDI